MENLPVKIRLSQTKAQLRYINVILSTSPTKLHHLTEKRRQLVEEIEYLVFNTQTRQCE